MDDIDGPNEPANSISCIIPTYNDGLTLRDAIVSVAQSNFPIEEIIIVDDGSDDNVTEQVVEMLRSELGCHLIFHKKTNGGPSSARNVGIDLAQGEWIAFLDSDDLLLPDSIGSKLKFLDACKAGTNVAGVYGSFIWSTTSKAQTFVKSCNSVSRDHIGVMGKSPGGAPSYLFKKAALEYIGGFDESLKFNEDFDLLLRLIKAGYGLIGTNEPGFIRNVIEKSSTRSNRLRSLKGSRKFLKKAFKHDLLSKSEVLRRLAINYISSGKEFLKTTLEKSNA